MCVSCALFCGARAEPGDRVEVVVHYEDLAEHLQETGGGAGGSYWIPGGSTGSPGASACHVVAPQGELRVVSLASGYGYVLKVSLSGEPEADRLQALFAGGLAVPEGCIHRTQEDRVVFRL